MALRTLSTIRHLEGKTVLIRIDADVDVNKGKIIDDTRLLSSLESIRYVLKHNGRVVLLGHLGRPGGKEDPAYTLLPVAKWYENEFDGKLENTTLGDFPGWKVSDNLSLVENLRYFDGEESNDPEFVKKTLFTRRYICKRSICSKS